MAIATQEVLAEKVAEQAPHLTNKNLISDQLFRRLTSRIVKDEGIEPALAERIVDQALGFLRLCATEPQGNYSPSPLVDVGWHTFILYTREYAAFCNQVAGFFIHHCPFDEAGIEYGTGHVQRTVEAMRAMGISVDTMLWQRGAACAKCNSDPNCGQGDPPSDCKSAS